MTTTPQLTDFFVPSHYSLSLDLSRFKERKFSGMVSITGDLLDDSWQIPLHAKGLDIESATIDGASANFSFQDFDQLVLTKDKLAPGEHIIVLAFSGSVTDSMHGLYPCYFEHQGEKKELIATQFESHHAREVFPCVDEPNAKATFDLTLSAQTNQVVLSNQPIMWQREEDELLVTRFETTPKMSSYLLAFVVGELHKKTAVTKRGIEVNVWASPAQPSSSLGFALDTAVQSIDFFEEYFDTAYPLKKADHVALPDFSSGAMENWGLITYRESCLLVDPKNTSINARRYVATVIAHELSHQWFGNLVTMKWWNNLWLNESFATLLEYIAVDAIYPDWNIWLDFATNESIAALRRDAIDGVQPVQVEVNHPDEISSIFDGAIVYAKGARLMKMCQQLVGHQAFKKGLSTYFKEFAYKNTEADDLWRHLSEASGKDIGKIMNIWISQSGYPVVHVSSDGLNQEQFFIGEHEKSNKLWPIPLDGESPEELPEIFETASLAMPIADDERLNIHNAGHFITNYQPNHLKKLLNKLAETNEIGRLQLLNEQTLLIRGGINPSSTIIDLLDAYRDEASESVWDIMAIAFGELKKFVDINTEDETNLKLFAKKIASDQLTRLGLEKVPNETEENSKLRAIIMGLMIYGEDSSVRDFCVEEFGKGIESIDPEIRALVIGDAVWRANDIELIKTLLDTYKNTNSVSLRDDLSSALTNARQPKQIELLLDSLANPAVIRPQDVFFWFAYLIRNRHSREMTWQWMKDNWKWIEDTFAGDKSYDYFPRYAASGLATREQLTDYTDFFADKRYVPALTRTIDLGIKEIEARVKLIETDKNAVIHKLKSISIE